ncbi:MAG: MarR family transcriptional regulator [Desulfobacula sp.]|nr:MarR family transcriptional regulator [Desulfobacula sp.]MDA8135843.1 MarR family transcriptional regulator [Desulfobacteraceae bacterium]
MAQILPDDVPDCMIFLLAKVYQKAHASFTKQLIPYGLTNMQHLVLESLWYKPGMTASQMGKFLLLDKATLSDVLDRMAKSGWVEKRPDEKDRRLFAIYTSQKADTLKQDLIMERRKANEELMKGFSPEEKILFRRWLMDIINTD